MTESKTVLSGTQRTLNGTAGADVLRGDNTSEIIRGQGGADRIYGNGGNDILNGGLGRDVLDGGAGDDAYVYKTLTDSYQGGGQNHADLIRNFVGAGDDFIDVSEMGFRGLGSGRDGTLTVTVNDAGTRTYLKSYDDDGSGDRFQVAFEGDISQYLTEVKIAFNHSTPSLPIIKGTDNADVLQGTDASEILRGQLGADRLYGNGGDDTLSGGLGRDILDGGAGNDTYLFSTLTESYQGGGQDHADLIRNFVGAGNDLIDVSDMGFIGLGDGHADTLAVAVNDAGTRTYLKSYAYDEGGDRFEVAFDGDVSQYLTEDRIIFSGTSVAAASEPVAPAPTRGEPGTVELLNVLPDDPSAIV